MIIDIHGHYTTEPAKLLAFREKQLAGLADPMRKPATSELGITDEELLKSGEPQLKLYLGGRAARPPADAGRRATSSDNEHPDPDESRRAAVRGAHESLAQL
jgi:hypothetical protein